MKNNLINNLKQIATRVSFFLALLFSSAIVFAQDKKVDVNISTDSGGGGNFWGQPWVWIVGGAVFLLLLVALLRNNNSSRA